MKNCGIYTNQSVSDGKFWKLLPISFNNPSRQKRVVNMNAFSNDFNKCLFNYWSTFVEKTYPVLGKPVKCKGIQLCYGANPDRTQFAVCYNKQTLIPEFRGHVLQPNIPEGGGRDEGGFRNDPTVGNRFPIYFCLILTCKIFFLLQYNTIIIRSHVSMFKLDRSVCAIIPKIVKKIFTLDLVSIHGCVSMRGPFLMHYRSAQ